MNRLWIVPRRASKHVELPAVATPRDKGGAESTFYFCVAWQYNRQDYTSGVSSVALCIRGLHTPVTTSCTWTAFSLSQG